MKSNLSLKLVSYLLLPLLALLAYSGCGAEEAPESQDKSPEAGKQSPVTAKPEKKLPVTVVGKWKDENKLNFDEDIAKGTASTSGTITFKENGKWESRGLVTLNGTLVGSRASNMKFQQESRGSWEKKGKEILRTWTELKLTPKATSFTALAIQAAVPPLVKGEKEKYEIVSLNRERMELLKTETEDKVTLIRIE